MKNYFHLYSYGAKTPDLFTSLSDFTYAVNLLAVLSFQHGISIIAYSIQDTHLHIIAFGEIEACLLFRREIQRLLRRKHGFSFELEMETVGNDAYLKRVCSYVICQATKDGKRYMPYDYPWSSASLYFRTGIKDSLWRYDNGKHKEVVKMSGIGTRKQREMFHTRNRLPEEWEVCEGMIMPSSFVNIGQFESIYRTHNAFRTFCGSGKNSDSIILDSMAEYHGVNLEENEARLLTAEKCKDLQKQRTITTK